MMRFSFRDYPATCTLVVVNIIVFVILEVMGLVQGYALYNAGVLAPSALMGGRWYTLFTSMFLHGGILHLACNMVTLWYVGTIIEDVFGTLRFLVVYFFAGLCGGLASMAVMVAQGNLDSGVVGASGAIFGLFAAYAYLLAREYHAPVVLLRSPTRDDLKGVASLLTLNIIIGLSPGIAMEAHLGGMLGGLIVSAPLYELMRHAIRRDIDAGLRQPSYTPPKPKSYDFEAAQAAQDAAMATQQAYADAYDSVKPAQRDRFEREVSARSTKAKTGDND